MNKISEIFDQIIHQPVNSVALVLSGGGARGAIQLGVLQALDDNNIKVEAIAGTSIGSIIGAFYSGGVSPLVMKEIMLKQRYTRLFRFSWNKKGLLTMDELFKTFDKYLPVDDFKSLKIPFFACASNLDTRQCEIFNSGNLRKAVAASASIPILFQPVEMNGYHYIDGGLYNNFPIEPLLKHKYQYILGINVNNYKLPDEYHVIAIAERIFSAVVEQTVEGKLSKCNYLINPYIENKYGIIDFSNTEKLFEIGYREGLDFVEKTR